MAGPVNEAQSVPTLGEQVVALMKAAARTILDIDQHESVNEQDIADAQKDFSVELGSFVMDNLGLNPEEILFAEQSDALKDAAKRLAAVRTREAMIAEYRQQYERSRVEEIDRLLTGRTIKAIRTDGFGFSPLPGSESPFSGADYPIEVSGEYIECELLLGGLLIGDKSSRAVFAVPLFEFREGESWIDDQFPEITTLEIIDTPPSA